MYNASSVINVFPAGHFWAGYTPLGKKRFIFHTAIAFMSLPFYYMFPFKFGLLMSPYLLYLAMRPRSEYVLPVMLQCLYGSQQRYFFVLGCFLYVLIHFQELRRIGLHWLYLLYMVTLPYFIWFFWKKMHMPMLDPGIGARLGGLFTHFVFSVAFWSALVVRKTGRPFFRGMVLWSFCLLAAMALIGGGARLGAHGIGEGDSHSVFSRAVFWAMPFMSSSMVYLMFSRSRGFGFERMLCVAGCGVIVADFFQLTKCPMSFTQVGLCLLAILGVFMSLKWRAGIVMRLSPLPLFVLSAIVVIASASLVGRYGGLNKSEGEYNEMSMTSFESIFKKLQRKAVDDRASLWSGTIAYIKRDILTNPIWVQPKPYIEIDAQTEQGYAYTIQWAVGAHNVMLDLIKQHGFYGGLGLYVLFVWFYCRKENRAFMVNRRNGPGIVIMAVCIAEGVVGGHCGHYLLETSFGVVMGCCLGSCWGIQISQNNIYVPT